MPQKKTLKQTALITGAAKRIGKAMALHLAALGFKIALHCHHSQRMAYTTAQNIKKHGGRCEVFSCDLGDEIETSHLIANVKKIFPDLSILINNASIFEPSNIKTLDMDNLTRHLNINFKTPYILTSQFAKACKRGQIINLLDANIIRNKSSHPAYLLSKKALEELTKLAAVELAPAIRVNAISPGYILPPQGGGNLYLRNRLKGIPLNKKGEPWHITHALEFLIQNPYVTGQTIFIDGGEHLI